jgi:predicted nucleic acid binding AN1-type Zn finger protein
MIKKHPEEWAAIEEERKERERKEDRELQRALLQMQMSKREEMKEAVKEESPKTTKAPYICDICGLDFGAKVTRDKHRQTHTQK